MDSRLSEILPNPRILCVDDDRDILDIYEAILSPQGAEILRAEDAPRALKQVEESDPDLILADIKMPGMLGNDLLKHLRSNGYEKPILVVTGDPDPVPRLDAVRQGANEVIIKPIQNEFLLASIIMVLNMKKGV